MIEGVETKIVSSLTIRYKGYLVDVGSGLSDQQRMYWVMWPNKIIGRTITVKYFSESIDKEEELSLRFPTFKGVRQD